MTRPHRHARDPERRARGLDRDAARARTSRWGLTDRTASGSRRSPTETRRARTRARTTPASSTEAPPPQSPVPSESHGAVAVVSGDWPAGTYTITLEGEGTADLYLEGTNDVSIGGNTGFPAPVREGTINLPATNPGIIGVGCTINRLAVDEHRRRERVAERAAARSGRRAPGRRRERAGRPARDLERARSAGSRARARTSTASPSRRSPRPAGSSSAR